MENIILKKIDPERLDDIQLLIGITGKMYIPERKHLDNESFVLIKPYQIKSNHTPDEVKEHWDAGREINFKK